VLELEALIGELGTVDALATSTLRKEYCQVDVLPSIKKRKYEWKNTYIAASEVTTLDHEAGDDLDGKPSVHPNRAHDTKPYAVEDAALVVQRLALSAHALLASAQRAEVIRGPRHRIGVQLPTKTRGDSVRRVQNDNVVKHTSKTMRPAGAPPIVTSKNT
jgi:hypothetical protein